jgi:hypothetical protein
MKLKEMVARAEARKAQECLRQRELDYRLYLAERAAMEYTQATKNTKRIGELLAA